MWVPSPADHSAVSTACIEERIRVPEDLPSSRAPQALGNPLTTKNAIQFLIETQHLRTVPSTCGAISPTSIFTSRTPRIRKSYTRRRLLYPGFPTSTTGTTLRTPDAQWPRRKEWNRNDVWTADAERSSIPSSSWQQPTSVDILQSYDPWLSRQHWHDQDEIHSAPLSSDPCTTRKHCPPPPPQDGPARPPPGLHSRRWASSSGTSIEAIQGRRYLSC